MKNILSDAAQQVTHDHTYFEPPGKKQRCADTHPPATFSNKTDIPTTTGAIDTDRQILSEGAVNCQVVTEEFSLLDCMQRISQLEAQNASLHAHISLLEQKLLEKPGQIENDLLCEIVQLSSDKRKGLVHKKAFSANIQKFAITCSTYSHKCFR